MILQRKVRVRVAGRDDLEFIMTMILRGAVYDLLYESATALDEILTA